MKYCMNCGVQVDETKHDFCPLCQTIIFTDEELTHLTKVGVKEKQRTVLETLQEEGRKIFYNKLGLSALILFFIFSVAIITLFIVDFSGDQELTWSLIPILSIILFDSVLNLIFLNEEKTFIYIASSILLILMGYFLGINYILSGNITWSYYIVISLGFILLSLQVIYLKAFQYLLLKLFLIVGAAGLYVLLLFVGPYGNPVINYFVLGLNAFTFVIGVITYAFVVTYIYNKYLIIAILSLAFTIFVKGLELLLNWHIIEEGHLNFSFYVNLILIPIAVLMFVLNNKQRLMDYLIIPLAQYR